MRILRGLKIAMIGLFLISTEQAFADVKMDPPSDYSATLEIFNAISRGDADYVTQHKAEFKNKSLQVYLKDSPGGDVGPAMRIGRIIRKHDASVTVFGKCFGSCALIYIAGVVRDNSVGLIGLHRPYFSPAPLDRQEIEREVPLMLQRIEGYVQSMGVTDLFYQEMVNTEPSDVRLYRAEEIKKLVSDYDPTYGEILTSHLASKYGISTAEMRRRKQEAEEKCTPLFLSNQTREGIRRAGRCSEAIYWGLSESVYEGQERKGEQLCKISDEDMKTLREMDIRSQHDFLPVLKSEACFRNVMLGR